jgi:hypothetical protein
MYSAATQYPGSALSIDSFNVIAIHIYQVCPIRTAPTFSRSAVVLAAILQSDSVKFLHGLFGRRFERQMHRSSLLDLHIRAIVICLQQDQSTETAAIPPNSLRSSPISVDALSQQCPKARVTSRKNENFVRCRIRKCQCGQTLWTHACLPHRPCQNSRKRVTTEPAAALWVINIRQTRVTGRTPVQRRRQQVATKAMNPTVDLRAAASLAVSST